MKLKHEKIRIGKLLYITFNTSKEYRIPQDAILFNTSKWPFSGGAYKSVGEIRPKDSAMAEKMFPIILQKIREWKPKTEIVREGRPFPSNSDRWPITDETYDALRSEFADFLESLDPYLEVKIPRKFHKELENG